MAFLVTKTLLIDGKLGKDWVVEWSHIIRDTSLSSKERGKIVFDEILEIRSFYSLEFRMLSFSISNLGVDHTGELLFELEGIKSISDFTPLCAFSSAIHNRRITLLPDSLQLIRLLKLTMEGNDGIRRSILFRVEDITICDGGVELSAIL